MTSPRELERLHTDHRAGLGSAGAGSSSRPMRRSVTSLPGTGSSSSRSPARRRRRSRAHGKLNGSSTTCGSPGRRPSSPSRSSRIASRRRSPARSARTSKCSTRSKGSEERLEAGEDYLTVMRDNLDALRDALGSDDARGRAHAGLVRLPAGPERPRGRRAARRPGEFVAVAGPNGGGRRTSSASSSAWATLERHCAPVRGACAPVLAPPDARLPGAALGAGGDAPATVREVVSAGRLAAGGLIGPMRHRDGEP